MTDVINLKQQRKAKARKAHEATAAANRAQFGRTKEEKKREALRAKRADKHLEGHKLEPDAE